jgi:hypothetical protein
MAFAATIGGMGCSSPQVLETGSVACADHVDNDDDGRTDCADDDCIDSDACERTLAGCRDRADEDLDGDVDCADEDCVKAGHCEAFTSDCVLGVQSGCPEAMTCFAAGEGNSGRQCARPGSTGDWLPCTRHTECGAARACVDGVCEWLCKATRECPSGALCVPRGGDLATCAPSCAPGAATDSCAVGGACRALGELGYVYDPTLPLAACVLAVSRPPSPGSVAEGGPCEVSSVAAVQCAPGLVCHPEDREQRCRAICASELRDRSQLDVPCPADRACALQDLDLSAPAPGLTTWVTGLCLPPSVPK